MSLSDFGLLQTGMCRNLSPVWRKQSAGVRATTSFCNLISKNGSTWCFGMAMMHRDIPHSSFALDLPTPSLWLLTVLNSHKQLVCILIFASWMVGRWRINFSISKCTKYDFIAFLQMANSEVLRLILAKTCNMHLLIEQQWQLGEKKFSASHHLFFHWPQDMKETQFWDWYIATFLQGLIIMRSSHFHPWVQFHRWSMVSCTCWVRRMHASLWW